jgi:uncharacterized membrane protein
VINNTVRFILVIVLALFVGTLFGIWMGSNPAKLSAAAYVELMQNTIRSLGPVMQVLGPLSIILTITLAFLSKERRERYLLFAAAGFIVVTAGITFVVNQPVNTEVMTWTVDAQPANWMELRDRWWSGHVARTLTAIAGLVFALLAVIGSKRSE